ncbi:MAG: PEP-CTERM sorting domain-containing protein [Gammaproteobacteria bacterium]|nr:PEP-CTERM sorting domain-containing protein [Gammaproteobacteria bacterium]
MARFLLRHLTLSTMMEIKMLNKFLLLFAIVAGVLSGPANASLISNTVGDSDCFGLGGTCADGDLWRDGLGGVFFNDYRDAGDIATASHTDIWSTPTNPSWIHSYSLGGETPISAFLDLFIAGFADIGSINLLADATVIATYNFPSQFQTVHALTVAVPLGLIDGSTSFSLSTGGSDGFIIDNSTLRIETNSTNIPEPASMVLVGFGLAGISFVRRRRQKV